jgi:trans-aconitate methyltransferase
MTDVREFWDALYAERPSVWSGRPNAVLVDEIGGVTPGRAADLGCGEGGDAIWLAAQGWSVTALDVSQTAIDRGRIHATEAGVDIDWQRQDLSTWQPSAQYDLVSACFLQSPVELPIGGILRRGLGALAPGGTLLVVQHAAAPAGSEHRVDFPTRDDVLAAIDAGPESFTVVTAEERTRTGMHRGEVMEMTDLVVRIERRS